MIHERLEKLGVCGGQLVGAKLSDRDETDDDPDDVRELLIIDVQRADGQNEHFEVLLVDRSDGFTHLAQAWKVNGRHERLSEIDLGYKYEAEPKTWWEALVRGARIMWEYFTTPSDAPESEDAEK